MYLKMTKHSHTTGKYAEGGGGNNTKLFLQYSTCFYFYVMYSCIHNDIQINVFLLLCTEQSQFKVHLWQIYKMHK